MSRGISMKAVIIGIIAFFVVLMVAVWVIAERTNPQMIHQTDPPARSR